MKNQFLLLALLISLTAQAQNFHPGLSLSPALTGNLLNNDGSVPDPVIDEYKRLENQTFGYSGYLFVQHPLTTRASLRFGIGYAQTSYVTDRIKVIFAQPEPTAPEYITFGYVHQDIIIPMLYQYNLGQRKNHFYVITGLSPQIKLRRIKTIRKDYKDGEVSKTKDDDTITDYRTLNLNGVFGIGYDLALSPKTHLFLQPTFDCNILGVAKSAALNRHVYSLGLNVGLIIN